MSVRVILYILSTTGFMVNFMLRTDINIALVEMIFPSFDGRTVIEAGDIVNVTEDSYSAQITWNETHSVNMTISPTNETQYFHVNDTHTVKWPPNTDHVKKCKKETPRFNWTVSQQAIIQGSFYASYFLSSGLIGLFVNNFGPSMVFGLGQFFTGFGTLLIPVLVSESWVTLVLLRSFQGLAQGATWPAFYVLVSRWVAPLERSRFVSATFGSQLGSGITYIALGHVVAKYGWTSAFYSTGTLCMIWCAFWFYNARDDPRQHPRISPEEVQLILKKTVHVAQRVETVYVPWNYIIVSPVVLSIAITNFGRIWAHTTLFIYGPIYLKNIVKVDIGENGVYNGIPYVISYFVALPMGWCADYVIKHEILSSKNVRRLYTAAAQIVPGLALLAVIYATSALQFCILSSIAVSAMAASCSGSMTSIVDISPNYSGPIFAYVQSIFMTSSFIAPWFASFVLTDASDADQWEILFQMTAAVAIITYLPYHKFASTEIQSWNEVKPQHRQRLTSVRSTRSTRISH